jgi:Domain of Unknown Function (DUF1080)
MCRGINKRLPALIGFVVIAIAVVAPGRGDDAEEFRPLFNGKDLEGWKATKPELWSVKDGMIIGKQERGQLKKNTFLATKELMFRTSRVKYLRISAPRLEEGG